MRAVSGALEKGCGSEPGNRAALLACISDRFIASFHQKVRGKQKEDNNIKKKKERERKKGGKWAERKPTRECSCGVFLLFSLFIVTKQGRLQAAGCSGRVFLLEFPPRPRGAARVPLRALGVIPPYFLFSFFFFSPSFLSLSLFF